MDNGFSWILCAFRTSGKLLAHGDFKIRSIFADFSRFCPKKNEIQCAPRVMFWLSSPHVTNIEEVSAQLLKFPSITICNVNPVLFSKVNLTVANLVGAR